MEIYDARNNFVQTKGFFIIIFIRAYISYYIIIAPRDYVFFHPLKHDLEIFHIPEFLNLLE